ncbi:LpqB family beta-propeller domain-containing protein [Virgisporangium aurantiacum]|uniref:Lipoprotein n=1 Tax=Virgisporangium aurantiacum TaxID=175570 RepID=A0A8J3YW25_9ACTN|nr:LpqB family beta-propeller domain-containing protein [Virgisporangium aurantiacum]GIJ52984.1 lipoprotein [Virgisporangium aurantiacum]
MRSKSRGDGRRLLRAALALMCVVVAAAGCGVPGSGEPEPLDDAPRVGRPVGPAGSVGLPEPATDISPVELVQRFLKTGAAADWDPALSPGERIPAAVRQAQRFLDPMATWKPGNSITVVQVIGELTVGVDNSVPVTLRQIGVLDPAGFLIPAGRAPATYTLRVDPKSKLLLNAPDNMLPLSLEGLGTLFEVRPVYYWDLTGRFLVPDRRYISAGISDEKRAKTIVARVLAGPSLFLSQPTPVVQRPPFEKPLDNATLNGDNVVVNLPPAVPETDLEKSMDHLATQLRWSLHPERYTVELRIGGRDGRTYSGTDYLRANPSQPLNDRNERRLFGAVSGKLVPIDPEVSPPSILGRPENSNVVAAAVNTKQNSAALVRQDGGGPRQLWVGRTPADRSAATFTHVVGLDGRIGPYSRPSYLPGVGDQVLIVADGNLYDVNLGTGEVTAVNLPLPSADPLVAVSVAPDGARIAMVTASKVYVATIDSTKLPVTIGVNSAQELRELYVGNLVDLRGVAWNFEHQIIVGGRSGLMIAAIDGGALTSTGPNGLQGAQLTQLSAVPWDPINNLGGGDVVIEASAGGTRSSYFPYSPIMRAVKAPESQSPSPSPSASATVSDPRVTAVFYADVI